MNLKKEIDRHFAPLLKAAGLERHPGPWLSYRKALPDIHYHVDVENHYYSNAFTVTLQTVDRNGNRQLLELSDFNNSNDYDYPGNSTPSKDNTQSIENEDETRAVVETACSHLEAHGIPWLMGIGAA